MEENQPKINIVFKGIREKPSLSERKSFIPENSELIVNEDKKVWGVNGSEYILKNKGEDGNIGAMYLWENDPILSDDVKLKQIVIDDYYQGSGAVYILYEKAFEKAQELHTNLVLDCLASISAFKSFQKFAREKKLNIVENEKNKFDEKLNEYKAPQGTWTLKIII